MHLIHSISLLLPQGSPRKMFPRGGGLLGVTTAAMNGPQPRSPRLRQCPSMKETWCASCSMPPAPQGLFPIYPGVSRGEGSPSTFPAVPNSLQPAHEEEGVIAGLLPCRSALPAAHARADRAFQIPLRSCRVRPCFRHPLR